MSTFYEDRLPVGQHVIETHSVQRFRVFMQLVRDPSRKHPSISTVTGPAGTGKTIAHRSYIDMLTVRQDSVLPEAVSIKVAHRATGKAVAMDIGRALFDKLKARNASEAISEVVLSIQRNNLKLLIVDEADSLNEDSFEVLRSIFDWSGCSIVLVGLPNLLDVIESKEKFASRVALRTEFAPVSRDEVLNIVLPQLIFPRWQFQGDSETDRELGALIWERAGSNLRHIRNLLQAAAQLAENYGGAVITPEIIKEAFSYSGLKWDKVRVASNDG